MTAHPPGRAHHFISHRELESTARELNPMEPHVECLLVSCEAYLHATTPGSTGIGLLGRFRSEMSGNFADGGTDRSILSISLD